MRALAPPVPVGGDASAAVPGDTSDCDPGASQGKPCTRSLGAARGGSAWAAYGFGDSNESAKIKSHTAMKLAITVQSAVTGLVV